jgi:hypothetical protein
MRVSYRNTTKAGAKTDPRFTIEPDGLPSYGDGDKARPCVEIPTDAGTLRIVMPRNVYIPGGQTVDTVSFEIGEPTVAHKAQAAASDSGEIAALKAQNEAMQAQLAALIAAMQAG